MVTPFHCTSMNAGASCAGGANELAWKKPILVLPTRERREGLRRRECARECIISVCRSKQCHRVAGVRKCLEEEDCRVVGATWGARADPVRVLGVEAEFVAFGEALESAVNDEVGALVSAREGHLKAALAGVDGGRGVRGDEVLVKRRGLSVYLSTSNRKISHHAAGVCCRCSINNSAPDVEVLACTALGVRAAGVALLSTRIDIIAIKESESHVLSFTKQAQYKIVPIIIR